MRIIVSFLLLVSFQIPSYAETLVNEKRDNEISISSNIAYQEETAEIINFSTSQPNQEVQVNIIIPFTVHAYANEDLNGAVRVYLNQVDSEHLIMNGGAWSSRYGVPVNGRTSGSIRLIVPDPGSHTLITRIVGSTTYTIMTLRSRRWYQVFSVN